MTTYLCTACGRTTHAVRYDREAGETIFDHGAVGFCAVANRLATFQARRDAARREHVGRAGKD